MKRYEATEALLGTVDFASDLLAKHQTYMKDPKSSLAGQHEEAYRRLQANAALVRKAEPDAAYQGWANRETWCAALWFSNESEPYNAGREIAQRQGLTDFERDAALEDYAGTRFGQGLTHWQRDMMLIFMARVVWRDVLNALREG